MMTQYWYTGSGCRNESSCYFLHKSPHGSLPSYYTFPGRKSDLPVLRPMAIHKSNSFLIRPLSACPHSNHFRSCWSPNWQSRNSQNWWMEMRHPIIVIGNPLMLSPDFPPLHTVHATFTAHGVPSLVILTIYYNLPCSFLGVAFPEFLLNLLSGAERSAFPFASYWDCRLQGNK